MKRKASIEYIRPIKLEPRSSSPIQFTPERTLVTAGTTRYAPLPPELIKGYPNYLVNRAKWAKPKHAKLTARGLVVNRVIFRADGLAIDWWVDDAL